MAKYVPDLAEKTAAETLLLRLTFDGISIGANLGPIVNEVFQGVFSHSRIIDTILSEDSDQKDRWALMNYATSSGAAGTHNAIIYLDNLLTPVLKNATYDPSQFIAAHGQLYRQAFTTMAKTLGAPSAGATTTPSGTESSNDSTSAEDLATRKKNADKSAFDQKNALRQAITDLTSLWDTAKGDVNEQGDWKDGAGENRVKEIRLKLNEIALRLEGFKK